MKFDSENKKITDSKLIIKKKKEKIKIQKKSIRKKKMDSFKKTRVGRILSKMFFVFFEKENYSFSQVFVIIIVSLLIGGFTCFSLFTIMSHGKNYFRLGRELSKFYDVYDVLSRNYYGDVDNDDLVEAAIAGMVNSVGDEYTNYSNVASANQFNQMLSGKYEGIGCTITMIDGKVVINSVYDDSPSQKAGLKAEDIIVSVDSLIASDVGTAKLADYIKNEANGKVKMTILREDEEITVVLERGTVEMPIVTGEVIMHNDKKIGYINISLFSSVSSKQFKKAIEKLEKEGISALVIDVRNNNGGYLTEVSNIISMLLPKGSVMYQVQRDNKKEVTKDKTSEKREYPIAIVTNNNSASASEILAAAIKESYNGFVVGVKTFGKGTVQQVKELSDGSIIKYTSQNWLTPDGNWINDVGIEPTIEVILSDEYYKDPTQENDDQLQKALDLVSK